MKKAKKLIELNNSYRELLNEENKEFYDDILVYIRAKSFFKNEIQIEESLLEILTDIIEAQNQKIKAKDYFGKNSKEISDEILKNSKNSSFKERFYLFFYCMLMYSFVTLLPEFINPNKSLDIGKFFICLVVTLLFVNFILNILGDSVYSIKNIPFGFIIFILIAIYITLIITLEKLLPNTIEFKLVGTIGAMIILIFGVIGVIFCLREKLFYSFLPIIIVACILGILNRLDFTNFLIIEESGKIISSLAMLIAFILCCFISYLQSKD